MATLLLGALVVGSTSAHALLFQEAIGNNGLDIFPNQPGDPFNFVGENDPRLPSETAKYLLALGTLALLL